MNKQIVVVWAKWDADEMRYYLYPEMFKPVYGDEEKLYHTCVWIEGRAARVLILSDQQITLPVCRDLAIAYMTGNYRQWSYDLREDEPKLRRTK